jgi:ATP:corrinoid adenosyltransferase
VVSDEEVAAMLAGKPEEMSIICTGRVLSDSMREYADRIVHILPEK